MIVDFGVCKYLYQEGSLYSCSDEDGNDSLLDTKGKTILKSKNLDINSSIGEYLVTFVTQHDANDKKGTISVYDYKGNVMTSFPTSSNKKPRVHYPTAKETMQSYSITTPTISSTSPNQNYYSPSPTLMRLALAQLIKQILANSL